MPPYASFIIEMRRFHARMICVKKNWSNDYYPM